VGENSHAKDPQDMIDLYSEIGVISWTEKAIDTFLNFDPKPTIAQIVAFKNLSNDKVKIANKAYVGGHAKGPQDIIDLFSGIGDINWRDNAINTFFSFDPKPTIAQIVAFRNLSNNKRRISNEAYTRGHAKGPQEMIDLFSEMGVISWRDEAIDTFFSLEPTPKEAKAFMSLTSPEKRESIMRRLIPILEKETLSVLRVQIMEKLKEIPSAELCMRKDKVKFIDLVEDISGVIDRTAFQNDREKMELCPICLESKKRGEFYKCANDSCKVGKNCYAVCAGCLKDSIQLQLKEHHYPLSCDNCGDELLLPRDSLEKMNLSDQRKNFNRGTILAYHKKMFPITKNCVAPNCINRIREQDCDENGNFDCLCGMTTCFKCGESHKGITCQQHIKIKKGDEAFQNLVRDPRSNIRPCPHCEVPTEKSAACDHMTCKECGHKWDWRLGKKGDHPVHFSKTDGSEPRTYRVKDDIDPKTGKVYGTYKENVSNY
jgi:hypothetical protein